MMKFLMVIIFMSISSMLMNYFFIQLMLMLLMYFFYVYVNSICIDFFSLIYLSLGVDSISYILLVLLLFMSFLIMLASLSSLNLDFHNKNFMFYFMFLIISLIFVFISLNLFMFYLFFELSLIPMFFLVLGWGYQYDRLEAGFYMFIYTFMFSLPLLMCLSMMDLMNLSMNICLKNLENLSYMYMYVFMNLAFLVKLPIYLLHLWLPKAHVEASVGGSMILASVMLKLGSYGILRFMMMFMNLYNLYSLCLVVLSLLGSLFTSLVCLRQMDLKILVAYSSIVHMGVLLSGMIMLKSMGILGGMIIMISHGLCSSGMFVLVNFLYERLMSRNMFMIKGMVLIFPYLTMLWFLISVNNMSSPPSLSLFGEYFLLLVIGLKSFKLIIIVSFILFFSACYSIFFYSYSQYGEVNLNLYMIKFISLRENLILIMHLIPLNLMFLNLFIFI
uniref:NADH-ubiquinone oxidoreductase chain 4 n=1 Tax=Conostigmus sp. MM-2013 TaxID=1357450 RepID=V9NK08_9HYME|nr:NADH dehydrogenase subunit 4 [Conostigmus sp. MM-2013]